MKYKLITFLILLKIIDSVNSVANVNDSCIIKGQYGFCKLLKHCKSAVHELNFNGIAYTKCEGAGYVGYNPIVCCPIEETISQRSIKIFYKFSCEFNFYFKFLKIICFRM